jgi:Holliday junction resolvase RusA-like endonuclease
MIRFKVDQKLIAGSNNYRIARNRLFLTKEASMFKAAVMEDAIAAFIGTAPFTGDVKVSIDVVFGDKRKRDLQNMKLVFDAMNKIAYEDDSQIIELSARKHYEKGSFYIIIEVEEI